MPPPLFTISTGGSIASDTLFGYVVDPVTQQTCVAPWTGLVEQPGTEGDIKLIGTTGKQITVDWTASAPPYTSPAVCGYRVYRTRPTPQWLCSTMTSTVDTSWPACASATTALDKTGSSPACPGSPPVCPTPVGSTLASINVDIPVRVKKSGKVGITELVDNIALRNTAR
jgi:hypothetical protein